MKKETNQIIFLLSFVAVPLLAGYLSSQPFADSISTSYSSLAKPVFSPPSWVFAPAWTVLYVLMGISAYLIWRKEGFKKPLALFLVQLVLNLSWMPLFFHFHQYFWAFIEIIILLLAITMTVLSFAKRSKPAAFLMLPYLFWVIFAAVLNYAIFVLNR